MTFTYDGNDNLTSIDYPDKGSKVAGVSFRYNPKTQWMEKVFVKETGSMSKKMLREYSYTSDNKVAAMKDYRGFAGGGNGYTLYLLLYYEMVVC